MTNLEKYNQAFCETLNVTEDMLSELSYQGIKEWDSIGHMELIGALEEAFDIEIETDDIVDFSSYKKGKEILAEKYDVQME